MAWSIVHNVSSVTHSLYLPLKIDLSPLDLFFLIVNTSTGNEIKQQKNQPNDNNYTDRKVVILKYPGFFIGLLLGDKNNSCLFLGVKVVLFFFTSVSVLNNGNINDAIELIFCSSIFTEAIMLTFDA